MYFIQYSTTMETIHVIFLCLVWTVLSATLEEYSFNKNFLPEQIHIAFGEKTNDITVTWSTMKDTKESVVHFGEKITDQMATGHSTLFIDPGIEKRKQWIHRVTLKDLKYDTKYGLEYEIKYSRYHVVVHNGDIAYNLDELNGRRGDRFMAMVEPVAANIPYMTTPGNHEEKYNFSHYKNRFTMPGGHENMFYSFNLGLVHFIAVNTEVYYIQSHKEQKSQLQTHYNWLVQDLEEATKKENREKYPWIILFGHRPMYCSSSTAWDGCRTIDNTDANYPQRVGIPKLGGLGMEILLKDYGVDLVIWAHEHYYERSWPLYNKTVYNGTHGPYINPGAPTHVTTGAGGNRELEDHFYKDPKPWSAFRSRDYGYGRLRVYNHTHLYWEEMSTEHVSYTGYGNEWQPNKIDEFWLVRDEHKPYNV